MLSVCGCKNYPITIEVIRKFLSEFNGESGHSGGGLTSSMITSVKNCS